MTVSWGVVFTSVMTSRPYFILYNIPLSFNNWFPNVKILRFIEAVVSWTRASYQWVVNSTSLKLKLKMTENNPEIKKEWAPSAALGRGNQSQPRSGSGGGVQGGRIRNNFCHSNSRSTSQDIMPKSTFKG